jgi:hypothetical protein
MRRLVTAAVALAALVLGTATAVASSDPASCATMNKVSVTCVIKAVDPGTAAESGGDDVGSSGGRPASDSGSAAPGTPADTGAGSPCFFTAPKGIYMPAGKRGVPCNTDQGEWSNELSCYLSPMETQPPARNPAWEGRDPVAGGAIYECVSDLVPPFSRAVWLADPPDVPTIAPGEVARMAVEQMDLRAIRIGITPAPGGVGIVGLPTWLWVDDADATTFGPITRTATAGGVTVTATARVHEIVWELGDGTRLTCATPGTPYKASFGKRPSPDCGHTYTQDSGDQPGGVFGVSATSRWVVEWEGAGQQGTITLDDLTSEVSVTIGEAQVLVS